MKPYEALYPLDRVLYRGKYYLVSNACYVAVDGMQKVSLIRIADIESNRMKRPSIFARADECKIIYESELHQRS